MNNLAKYMDKENEGMVKISDVEMALTSDKYSPVSLNKRKWMNQNYMPDFLNLTINLKYHNSNFLFVIY